MRFNIWFLGSAMVLSITAGFISPSAAQAPNDSGPIQDNGFLIEEAYNQEEGVVQHISSFAYFSHSKDWNYNFTQEWPMPWDSRHQLSYSISGLRVNEADDDAGLGDVAINYRYQLVGDGQSRIAIAPRFTLFLPTGSSEKGRGYGTPGYQINLPASLAWSGRIVTHVNVGGTVVPNAKNIVGERAKIAGYNLGASAIALVHPKFNLMLETLWAGQNSVTGEDLTDFGHSLFISPGIRWAHDLQNGLQIVPGLAVATGIGPSRDERALIFYLSFEHPFR